jgi:hypothetical protein
MALSQFTYTTIKLKITRTNIVAISENNWKINILINDAIVIQLLYQHKLY